METSAYIKSNPILTDVARNRLYRKITLRLAPFLFLSYVVNQLDRFNISFAKLQFMRDVGLSDFSFGLGAGLFFIGYVIFEVPSNLYLQRTGARATFIRIMVLWGIISTLTAFVQTPLQLYFSRFLLGAAEAGFMPGVVLYLTYWFPASRRAQITSWFFIAIAAAGIFGGPISGSILKYAATWGAMKGWQWLFVVEGIPATVLGIFAYFYLQDRPQDARWLSNDEKSALLQDLEAEQAKPSHSAVSLRDIIKLPRIYAFGLAYFAIVASNNTLAVWAPTMIKDAGVHDVLAIGVLSAIPYIVGAIGMHLVARHSDETGERRWHFVLPFMTTTIGFALIGFFRSNIFETIALLSLASFGIFAAFVIFWTMPTQYLAASAKAAGIGYISTIGMFGGFFSPIILGFARAASGSLSVGFVVIAAIAFAGLALIFVAAPRGSTQ